LDIQEKNNERILKADRRYWLLSIKMGAVVLVGTIEIVMRKIAPSGNVSETVLVSLPGTESQEATHSSGILTFPGLEIHIREQAVYHNGTLIPLSHHEFFTLLYLAEHPSWVLSQSMIYEAVWKADPEHCGAAVTNVISQLQRKIGDGYIETVVGSGYRFVREPQL